ncbi:MAG: glycosyltransferase, partial [Alphaproteobacteria bacterium]|nr:glycosyltransferase [Alphaproteobacteria bacterium]
MKILFAFENPLPSAEADAEVFITTAKYLAGLCEQSWLHLPAADQASCEVAGKLANMPAIRARAPLKPAALRHLYCGLSLVRSKEFRQADLVYTRNLWVAWMAVTFGQRVAFDHYRPWPDQIPPLQAWLYRLICDRRFLVNICHSNYTRAKYLKLGIPAGKLDCVHNGYEPERLQAPVSAQHAKAALGLAADRKTVVYTGRVNHKKGLHLVIEAARKLPEIDFVLVGSYGEGPIEQLARPLGNVRIVPWQAAESLGQYIFAADVLLIPPSWQPLAEFGSTVLPLKLFSYMASGRPILAGRTPDIEELLRDGENALLCPPDDVDALVTSLATLTGDPQLAARVAAVAQVESRSLTWEARAR